MWHIAFRGLVHFWRSNLVISIGIAAATAVLTGALIVGDSMRTSLRELTLERLGQIDEMLIAEGFIRQKLAVEIEALPEFREYYDRAIPLILFPNGAIETSLGENLIRRSAQVNVLGIPLEFWDLGDANIAPVEPLKGRDIAINAALASDLGITADHVANKTAVVTVRIPKPSQLPPDSTVGKKNDLVSSLVDLNVVHVVPNRSLGQFGLHTSQSTPQNIYVSIDLISRELARGVLAQKPDPKQCNVILLSGKDAARPPNATATENLKLAMRPSFADLGLTLTRAKQEFEGEKIFDYWSVSADRMVLTDSTVTSVKNVAPKAKPVFTYLANEISRVSTGEQSRSGIPFSMVSAIDFDAGFKLVSIADQKVISRLSKSEIVLNKWAADDIGAKVGDSINVTYFEPETTHGNEVERSVTFRLAAIADLTKPEKPFVTRRRGQVQAAEFGRRPTMANDPDLTPFVAGVTDAASIDAWDLPFATADKIRVQDDQYWKNYRTTPKAFVALAVGQQLWGSRFGQATSMRIEFAGQQQSGLESELAARIVSDQVDVGLNLVPVKRNGLAASSGSTPFDVLFLALSMFVIAAALILVSLLFRLALAQRSSEIGLLLAIGFEPKRIARLWLREMLLVAGVGVVLGTVLGVGYAAVMIHGLKTWWVGAISRPFLQLHLSTLSLVGGAVVAIAMCVLTIMWSVRTANKSSVRSLLTGDVETANNSSGVGWISKASVWVCLVVAIGLAGLATQLGGEPQAGAFMGAGFLLLFAGLTLVRNFFRSESRSNVIGLSIGRLAKLSGRRAPLRSTLTIGLVAVSSFLIMAVSSFRLKPSEEGTYGFDWVARSNQPIFADLNTIEGQQSVLTNEMLPAGSSVYSLRYKTGEDASCNNLYQSTQPQVLGMPATLLERLGSDVQPYSWAGSIASTDEQRANPWLLLSEQQEDGAVPVVIDKNTANYSLKIFAPGGIFEVDYDSGESVKFRVVGFLANSILQGSLVVSEENFVRAFPEIGGYQYFLIDESAKPITSDQKTAASILETSLSDQGFDARSATELLDQFMRVQNTYISTFQTLGALGLLLGTFGLGAVQVRNIVERRAELGLMQSVGFSRGALSKMILIENAWLLVLGMAIGIGAAIFTTLPHYLVGGASVPWLDLSLMFSVILIAGLVTAWIASRMIARMPLLESLRR